MGRSRAAPSSSRGSSFHAPPPTRTAAPAGGSHHQQQQQSHQQSHAQPQTPPPQVTNVYVQRGGMSGGGGMGFMGTVASVAAGSVAGHAISNMLFSRDHPPAEPAQAQAVAQQYGEGACGPQIKGYAKCMEVNAQNAQACNWAWDMFMQCQEQKGTGTA